MNLPELTDKLFQSALVELERTIPSLQIRYTQSAPGAVDILIYPLVTTAAGHPEPYRFRWCSGTVGRHPEEGVELFKEFLAKHGFGLPGRKPKAKSCPACGAQRVFIRGRHPGEDNREVCPTCVVESLESLVQNLQNQIPKQQTQA